ncbi:hypothetical protein PCE1_003612 [Barthelona sp. PCE]
MKITDFECVLFDLDGTLIDNAPHVTRCYQKSMVSLGYTEPAYQFVYDLQGISFEDTCRALGVEEERIPEFGEIFWVHMASFDEAPTVFPHVRETMEFLKNEGIKMGIVTSNYASIAETALKLVDLHHYFSAFIGSDVCKKTKPNPDPILACLKLLDHDDLDSVLYIGDSESDVKAMANTGIKGFWVIEDDHYERRINAELSEILRNNSIPRYEYLTDVLEHHT